MEALRRLLLVLAMGWMVLGSFVLLLFLLEESSVSVDVIIVAIVTILPPVGVWWIAQALKK